MKINTCISLLRGINVGGQKKILMKDLKALYEELDFGEVTPFIQSGNVVFNAGDNLSARQVARKIEAAIDRKFGFFVHTIVRTREELEQSLKNNPFLQEDSILRDKLHLTFLEDIPDPEKVELILKSDFSPDRFIIRGKDVFVYCPGGYGITKINNTFFESRLKRSATTRNWKTVINLVEIATELELKQK
jgi:uncharacterized protein (DUF1697 family)